MSHLSFDSDLLPSTLSSEDYGHWTLKDVHGEEEYIRPGTGKLRPAGQNQLAACFFLNYVFSERSHAHQLTCYLWPFCTPTTECSCCTRDQMAGKTYDIYYLAFNRKGLLMARWMSECINEWKNEQILDEDGFITGGVILPNGAGWHLKDSTADRKGSILSSVLFSTFSMTYTKTQMGSLPDFQVKGRQDG